MILKATFKSKGRVYSLSLDTDKADRNYDDENYAEWFITADDKRILEITVWKDALGRFTHDGTVEVYKNQGDFEDNMLLDKKYIKLHDDTSNNDTGGEIRTGTPPCAEDN